MHKLTDKTVQPAIKASIYIITQEELLLHLTRQNIQCQALFYFASHPNQFTGAATALTPVACKVKFNGTVIQIVRLCYLGHELTHIVICTQSKTIMLIHKSFQSTNMFGSCSKACQNHLFT